MALINLTENIKILFVLTSLALHKFGRAAESNRMDL